MTYETGQQDHEVLDQPTFSEFVFKVASRCNMQPREIGTDHRQLPIIDEATGCNQCYEYVGNDAWKRQPPFMELDVIQQASKRIADHADEHGLKHVRVIGHGGEILMARDSHLDAFASTVRSTIEAPDRNVHLSIQTNGLLLTEKKLDILQKHRISVGLSLDGNKTANDRHRKDRLGKSTYDRAVRTAQMLSERAIPWGILTVIDPRNDPEETLESLAALGPQSISMFPPHANWNSLPKINAGAITLGAWQTRIFKRYRDWHLYHPGQERPPFKLPLADGYIEAMLGAPPLHERISNRYPHELFILPNGDYQRLDTLKSTEAGAYRLPYNVFDHEIDTIGKEDPGFIARRMGKQALAKECLECPLVESCGGDYYPLRYKADKPLTSESTVEDYVKAFKNPSIYCRDQKEYLGAIALFVAQQKEIIAPSDVDITQAWKGSHLKSSEHEPSFNIGYFMNDYGEDTSSLSFESFMGAVYSSLAEYKGYDNASQRDKPRASYDYIEPLFNAINVERYSGRLLLRALQVLFEQLNPTEKVYFEPSNERLTERLFRTIDDVTCDLNYAIVKALFNKEHMFLGNTDFRLRKCGEHWLVTQNAVEQHARYMSVPGNAFVGVAHIPEEHALELESGDITVETELAHAIRPHSKRSVRVTLSDAPKNLLLVSHTSDTKSGAQIDALEEVAARLPAATNVERFSRMLRQEESSVIIRPLSGEWPFAKKLRNYRLGQI